MFKLLKYDNISRGSGGPIIVFFCSYYIKTFSVGTYSSNKFYPNYAPSPVYIKNKNFVFGTNHDGLILGTRVFQIF